MDFDEFCHSAESPCLLLGESGNLKIEVYEDFAKQIIILV